MSTTKTYSVVDAGNTRISITDFVNDEIILQKHLPLSSEKEWQTALSERKNNTSILASVLSAEMNLELDALLQPSLVLNEFTPLPIQINEYDSRKTLGADRIANAVAIHALSTTTDALAVDLGTCIKFDYVENGIFVGGSISPGYALRMRAMHEFTGKLPLIQVEELHPLIGKSTKSCMLSGVMNGIQAEISSFIDQYQRNSSSLTIFLTGGDRDLFDKKLINSIFVVDNLTAKGLLLILKHNV